MCWFLYVPLFVYVSIYVCLCEWVCLCLCECMCVCMFLCVCECVSLHVRCWRGRGMHRSRSVHQEAAEDESTEVGKENQFIEACLSCWGALPHAMAQVRLIIRIIS